MMEYAVTGVFFMNLLHSLILQGTCQVLIKILLDGHGFLKTYFSFSQSYRSMFWLYIYAETLLQFSCHTEDTTRRFCANIICSYLPLICSYLPLICSYLPLTCSYLPLICSCLPLICGYLPWFAPYLYYTSLAWA